MLKIAWSPVYAHPLPEGHRFPMEKYNLIPEQLLYEGTIGRENLFKPKPLDTASILLTHQKSYWEKLRLQQLSPQEIRRMGFPMSPALVEREIIIGKGTEMCAHFALEHGISINASGGTHHAFSDRGEGFCLLNDIGMAANCLLRDNLAKRILIVDLDVHQGNGTAEIFRDEPRVFTFSMHCGANFPLEKAVSDHDVSLAAASSDAAYLSALAEALPYVLRAHAPDFVFYLSGVDILSTDKLGKLNVSRAACKARDRMVFETLRKKNLPVSVCMGGGYSHRLADIVEAHANTYRLAQEIW
ncbi:MAG TPA: histone deacetylase [Bacteroidetes bacterium]|nr:histone deacetylase [Bacteroidota bacterium]